MTWRMAKALETLLAQINALSPSRDKSSDGGIGNAEHSARTSDHNPDDDGVVKARDFTHDPAHGIDSEQLAEALRASRDPRIKYIISNRKIAASYATGGKAAWEWRPYSGSNPHNHHCHVSVLADAVHYDDTKPWLFDLLGVTAAHVAAPVVVSDPVLRKGDKGPAVVQLQGLLNKHGAALKVDGDFGKGTKAAVILFQENNSLVADGVVGGYTWKVLRT